MWTHSAAARATSRVMHTAHLARRAPNVTLRSSAITASGDSVRSARTAYTPSSILRPSPLSSGLLRHHSTHSANSSSAPSSSSSSTTTSGSGGSMSGASYPTSAAAQEARIRELKAELETVRIKKAGVRDGACKLQQRRAERQNAGGRSSRSSSQRGSVCNCSLVCFFL